MHPNQDDNLLVLHGERNVDIYTKEYGKVESFTIAIDCVYKNSELVCLGRFISVWPRGVFHRNASGEDGLIANNLATAMIKPISIYMILVRNPGSFLSLVTCSKTRSDCFSAKAIIVYI